MGDYGIKVALQGTSIDSTDPRDYAFNSAVGGLKIFSEGLGTVGIANNGTSFATVTHNLGFAPMVMTYAELVTNQWYVGVGVHYESETIWINGTGSSVGTDNFVLRFNNQSGGSVNTRYKYFLLGDLGLN